MVYQAECFEDVSPPSLLTYLPLPTAWKISNITPVYKDGDPKLASNYHPISLCQFHPNFSSALSTTNLWNVCCLTPSSPGTNLALDFRVQLKKPSLQLQMTGTSTLTLFSVLFVLHLTYQKLLTPSPIEPYCPIAPESASVVVYSTGSITISLTGNKRLFWMDMSLLQPRLPWVSPRGRFWAPYFLSPWIHLLIYSYQKTLGLFFTQMTSYYTNPSCHMLMPLLSNLALPWL